MIDIDKLIESLNPVFRPGDFALVITKDEIGYCRIIGYRIQANYSISNPFYHTKNDEPKSNAHFSYQVLMFSKDIHTDSIYARQADLTGNVLFQLSSTPIHQRDIEERAEKQTKLLNEISALAHSHKETGNPPEGVHF